MGSVEYDELKDRLLELRAQFVQFEIPPDRAPTSQELSQIAAFKLLMHADVQTYIQDRILRAISENVAAWTDRRVVSRCIFHLVVRWSDKQGTSDFYPLVHDGPSFDGMIARCAKRAVQEISENNSIKKDAFLRMCFSAGLSTDDIAPTLLGELDSFGKGRGDVAHRSAGKVRTLNAPHVEAQSAQNIVDLLEKFDQDLHVACPG